MTEQIDIPFKLNVMLLKEEFKGYLEYPEYGPAVLFHDQLKVTKAQKSNSANTSMHKTFWNEMKVREDSIVKYSAANFVEVILDNTGFTIKVPEIKDDEDSLRYLRPSYIDNQTLFPLLISHPTLRDLGWEWVTYYVHEWEILTIISQSGYMNQNLLAGSYSLGKNTWWGNKAYLSSIVMEKISAEDEKNREENKVLFEGVKTTKWIPGHMYHLLSGKRKIIYLGDMWMNKTDDILAQSPEFDYWWWRDRHNQKVFVDLGYIGDNIKGLVIPTPDNKILLPDFISQCGDITPSQPFNTLRLSTRVTTCPGVDLGECIIMDPDNYGTVENVIETIREKVVKTLPLDPNIIVANGKYFTTFSEETILGNPDIEARWTIYVKSKYTYELNNGYDNAKRKANIQKYDVDQLFNNPGLYNHSLETLKSRWPKYFAYKGKEIIQTLKDAVI